MLTFRLNFLFCLVMVVGVALMWWQWACRTEFTANRLLVAREVLKSKKLPAVEFHSSHQTEPISSAQAARLLAEARIPKSYAFSNIIGNVNRGIYHFDRYYADLWVEDCRLLLTGYQVKGPPVGTDFAFHWQADWPAIEAMAREEDWIFYRQITVTLMALLTIGWAVRSRRK
ncbi:MAG: hypothetical protein ACI9G1_000631 [Pirellulaceae bacterium]|jgi:hypothetical protein